jgi:hypothetical protein
VAKPSGARIRPLQAVVGRLGSSLHHSRPRRNNLSRRSRLKATTTLQSRRPRAAHTSWLLRGRDDRRAKPHLLARPPGDTRAALGGAAAKLAVEDELDSMDARAGQPSRLERREAIRPPRYNRLHLGGPVRARQARNHLNSSRNATPASSSRSRQSHRKTAQTTPKPGPEITLPPRATLAARLANTSPSSGPPKHNDPGHDLDSRRGHSTRAAAYENPLPLSSAQLVFQLRALCKIGELLR